MTESALDIPDLSAASRIWAALDDAPLPADAPSVTGFRVLSVLGTGGQATTWLAQREADGVLVALKVARFGGIDAPTRHWSELRILSECRLACVARFEGSGIAEGHPWLATEFIDGPSLDSWAAGRGTGEVLEMLARVADALTQLHAAGFVHRDIKPSNVIIASGDQPVLIDLGLGASIESPLDRTIDGLPSGSPAFMSPEQARGERAVIGPPSDLWSLGATAFLLLAGEPPHASAGSVAAQVARAGTEPPRRARAIAPTLPCAVAEVLDWSVKASIADRPADAVELARAFRSAAAGHSIAPGTARRTWLRASVTLGLLVVSLSFGSLLPVVRSWLDGDRAQHVPLSVGTNPAISAGYPRGRFGSSVAVVGDLDGDRLDEVAVGAPGSPGRIPGTPYVEMAGEVGIVRGADIARALEGDVTGGLPPVHRVFGTQLRGSAGAVVAGAGDLDGDGVPELAVLSPGAENEVATLFVVSGIRVLSTKALDDGDPSGAVVRVDGIEVRKLPSGIASCDVDGDGLADLLVGCPGAGPSHERQGAVLVLHGSRNLFSPVARDVRTHRVAPPDGTHGFGASLTATGAGGGSVVVVGAPLGETPGPRGTGHAVLAKDSEFGGTDLRTAHVIAGGGPDDWFGFSVSACTATGHDPSSAVAWFAIGGPGEANAENDAGLAELFEVRLTESPDAPVVVRHGSWRGAASMLGRGELMGRALAVTPPEEAGGAVMLAVCSPRSGEGGIASGAVRVRRVDGGEPIGIERCFHGDGRAQETGTSVAWWNDPKGPGSRALLIGAPAADAPDGTVQAGVVWIVRPDAVRPYDR